MTNDTAIATAADLQAAQAALGERKAAVKAAAVAVAQRHGGDEHYIAGFARAAGLDDEAILGVEVAHLNAGGLAHYAEAITAEATGLDAKVREQAWAFADSDYNVTDAFIEEFFEAAGIAPGQEAVTVTISGTVTFTVAEAISQGDLLAKLGTGLVEAGATRINTDGLRVASRRARV